HRAQRRDAAHRVLARDPSARPAADLDHPAALDRQHPEGLVHRVLLHLPGAPEHDRRGAGHRADAGRHGAVVPGADARADQADRLPGCAPADLRRHADESRAGRDRDGAERVLLEHERGRLRSADLEEHVRVQADVGGDPADRHPRLPAQRSVPPRRAPRARLAPRLARRYPSVDVLLEIKGLGKTYGTVPTPTHAVGNVSFTVDEGEFVCVVGPSGCGKTTLLKCIGGLLRPSAGQVLLRGSPVTGPPERMALVFQEYSRSLMPWMSVRNNVLLPLRHKKLSKRERTSLVEDALGAVGLVGFMDRYPWQLSGGMQQRVAIARALAYQPSILLTDEPFASVDAQTRGDLEDLVLRVRDEFGITILFVTHDIDESVYLSDRIVVL